MDNQDMFMKCNEIHKSGSAEYVKDPAPTVTETERLERTIVASEAAKAGVADEDTTIAKIRPAEEPLLPFLGQSRSPVSTGTFVAAAKNNSTYPSWLVYVAIPGLLVTSALAIFLIDTSRTNTVFSGSFYTFTIENRATIQIFIQVLSHVLGSIHLFAITAVFNAFTRRLFSKRAISLDFLSILPPAFWAGATTPVATSRYETRTIQLPQYGADPQALFWNVTIGSSTVPVTRNQFGSFSYSPVRNILGSVLDEAALAIAPNTEIQTHRKLDNSGYTYIGRSYGVGASIGLSSTTLDPTLERYRFFEDGYISDLTCWYNRTMGLHVFLGQAASASGIPDIYFACGDISNGSGECVSFPGYSDQEVVAMLGHTKNGVNQLGLTTGISASAYTALNQTSCNIFFTPKRFVVDVDSTQKTITVSPTEASVKDIDPTSNANAQADGRLPGQVVHNILDQMGMLCQASASAEFSPLGNALIANIANAFNARSNGFIPTNLNDTELGLLGIESSLSTMVDSFLLAYSSAQFIIAGANNNGIQTTTMDVTVAGIRIGESSYIYTIAAINFCLIMLLIIEAVRNRGWKDQGYFDYRDLKSVIVGASIGGDGVASEVMRRKEAMGEEWVGDPSDRITGKVMVVLNGEGGGSIGLGSKSRD
ncbi:uncharacterized protein PAC_14327 [Phialocephala subalpina]|uniref:Uncharacterized protein n=1 Tax=Phialocephala subalpina TaxID=576137 RepID=A0A1L7XHA4_9HELO|nr:uncharacterized protein PAC_14327 [Phialocephala subalpina]